MELAIVFEAT